MIVVVAGMPRSGSTLQSNIVKVIVEDRGLGQREDWSIDWQEDLSRVVEYIQDAQIHILKAHWVNDDVIKLMQDYPGRCYLLSSHRDVRDVAVSMMLKFDYSFSKAKARIGKAIENLERIRVCGVPILEQDYPRLRYSLECAVADVARFLAIKITPDEAAQFAVQLDVKVAYQKSREKPVIFESIRRKLAYLFRTKFPYADSDLMLHAKHVSSHMGESGIWREKLANKQVQELENLFPGWCDERDPR